MSLSSDKSKHSYNRAAHKNVAHELKDEHFTYDPWDYNDDNYEDYHHQTLEQLYTNRLFSVLAKLQVFSARDKLALLWYW